MEFPQAVLFCCDHNAVRSPMAEGLMKKFYGQRAYVQSAGVKNDMEVDGFSIAVCAELGIELSRHRSRSFEEMQTLGDDLGQFDLIIALSALWIFFIHSRSIGYPLFKREMVRDRAFLVGIGFMVILGITNVGLSAVLPTMYQTVYGYDVMDTGLLMAPRGCGVLLMMLVTSRIIAKIDSRIMITLGYLLAALSLWTMTTWSLDMDYHMIALSGFIQGLGLGLVFVPINLIAFSSLSPQYRTDGTTLMTLFRNLGSSFGISVIVTVLARNIQTSHADIGANITSFNVPAIDPASTAEILGGPGSSLLYMLDGEVNRQAAMIAYIDNFYMLFWLILCIAPLAWIVKRPASPGAPTVDSGH